MKLAISYFSGIWKFCDLPLHKRRINPNLTNSSVLPSLPPLQLLECLSWYMWTITWQWNFHLISVTIQDWTGLCDFLLLIYRCSTKVIDFRLQASLICNFLRASIDRTFPDQCFLCLSVNFEKLFRNSFIEHLFYRAPLRNCLFHVQDAEFQSAITVTNYFTPVCNF